MIEFVISPTELTLIDEQDLPVMKAFKWQVIKTPKSYVVAKVAGKRMLYLHRLLTEAPPNTPVDHVNGNSLDNRRKNLRLVTVQENVVNSPGWAKSKRRHGLPYKGVFAISRWRNSRDAKPFEAKLMIDGRQKYLGCFKTMEEAARAYDAAVVLYKPWTAYLNFPEEHGRI